ncbi:MFS transporter, partial [Stenotrophomonas maltophilia]
MAVVGEGLSRAGVGLGMGRLIGGNAIGGMSWGRRVGCIAEPWGGRWGSWVVWSIPVTRA